MCVLSRSKPSSAMLLRRNSHFRLTQYVCSYPCCKELELTVSVFSSLSLFRMTFGWCNSRWASVHTKKWDKNMKTRPKPRYVFNCVSLRLTNRESRWNGLFLYNEAKKALLIPIKWCRLLRPTWTNAEHRPWIAMCLTWRRSQQQPRMSSLCAVPCCWLSSLHLL